MATKKQAKRKGSKRGTKAVGAGGGRPSIKNGGPGAEEVLTPKAIAAVRRAADTLWEAGATPHRLIRELHEVLLLRCLKEADGNYAAAAEKFGPSRQSVQQYANSPLRDERWRPYQQNRRRSRKEED